MGESLEAENARLREQLANAQYFLEQNGKAFASVSESRERWRKESEADFNFALAALDEKKAMKDEMHGIKLALFREVFSMLDEEAKRWAWSNRERYWQTMNISKLVHQIAFRDLPVSEAAKIGCPCTQCEDEPEVITHRLIVEFESIKDAVNIVLKAQIRMLDESRLAAIFGTLYRPYRLLCNAQKYLKCKISEAMNV